MKISDEFRHGSLRISLCGELDHHGAKAAMAEAALAIEKCLPRECVLDMERVSFMDSSGIALILNAGRKMNSIGGKLRVENVSQQPMKVVDASGIERIIDIREAEK